VEIGKMNAVSLTINNNVITYRELTAGSQPRDGTVTIKHFLQYSEQLFCASEVDNTCQKIKHYCDFRTDANENDYDPTTPQSAQDKVWRTLQNLIPSFQEKNPEYIEVDNNFLDTIFTPLVPDSLFLKKVQSQNSQRFVKSISTICLLAEVIIREFVSGFISFGLHIYSIYNPDYTAFFRLRLDINRYRPYHILSDKFFAWIGGY
jgi:hypothetical protein